MCGYYHEIRQIIWPNGQIPLSGVARQFVVHLAAPCLEQQQQVSLLPDLQQHESHLHSAPHLVVAHLQPKSIDISLVN